MRMTTKTIGLLFLAASSVYTDSALRAAGVGSVNTLRPGSSVPTKVRALADATDPVASPRPVAASPATQPTTRPAGIVAAPQPVKPEDVALADDGTVEIHVNDANVAEVLRMLSLQSQRNIIASKEVRGTITANLYGVTMKEALDAILKPNGFDYREKGNFLYVYSAKEIADQEKATNIPKTELFRLFYTPAVNAANMIKPVLSEKGQVAFTTPAVTGIGSDDKDAGGNTHATEDILVVTDFPSNLEQVRKVLKEVDRRPQQILVEAVILQATLQENNDLGIDFTALGGVDFSSLSPVGAAANTAGTGVAQALSGDITSNPAANKINDSGFVAGNVGGNGLKLGIVKNNIGLFLSALEGVTDTVILANPKVLVLNKQKGEVHVGSEQGYRTAVTTETLTADNVQFLETGTRLVFRPYVGDNGNIRMEIHPEDSSGSVNAQGLPNKFVTQITTNVMVHDGRTIVIGGLFREATSRVRTGVPGLQNLPGIGAAFRHQTDNTQREEVIILLTPHIIKDEAAYAVAGEETLRDTERLRVGMRQGLMPWGRERLAQSWYEAAQAEMDKAKPDRQRALWFLNAAVDANPLFHEAILLKTQVSGHEAYATDSSAIRLFLRKQVLADRAAGRTVKTAPRNVMISPTTAPAPAPRTTPALQARSPQPLTPPAPAAPRQAGATTHPAQASSNSADPANSPVQKTPLWTHVLAWLGNGEN